jgi:hypothetical protein
MNRVLPALLVLAGVLLAVPASARWKPEYAAAPQLVRDWYEAAELTPAAKRRFPFKNCCDHADVVRTRFQVNKTTAGDEWFWLDGATWRQVPSDIIHWGEHAPDGQPTLFVYDGKETCFYPGQDGQ